MAPEKLFVAREILLCDLHPPITQMLNLEPQYILNILSHPAVDVQEGHKWAARG